MQSGVRAPRLVLLVRKTKTAIAIAGGPKLPSVASDFRRFSRYDKLAVNFLSTVVLARVVDMNKVPILTQVSAVACHLYV
jgi:hypothetical protein